MMNVHPQRWNDEFVPWVSELVGQNFKNVVKRILIRMTEDGRRRTEYGRRRTEDGRRRTEGWEDKKSRKAEGQPTTLTADKRTEDGVQKTEDGG